MRVERYILYVACERRREHSNANLTAHFTGAFGAAAGAVEERTIDTVHPGEVVVTVAFEERGQVLALPEGHPIKEMHKRV